MLGRLYNLCYFISNFAMINSEDTFLDSIYPKKIREDWMRYAGFVINFHFFAKKVIFCNLSGNLISHRVLEIETSRVMSNQL